jgi:hypothetical protein
MTDQTPKLSWLFTTADRLETIYLAVLRIMVLVIATLALIVAIWIAGDGLRSLLTSTKVEAEPVTVSAAEVLQASRDKRAVAAAAAGDAAAPAVPKAVSDRHAAFMKTTFGTYHRLYAQTSSTYRKPEDKALTPTELAERLGYDLQSYADGEDMTVKLFVEDEAYSGALLAAAQQVVADAGYRAKLAKYKAAQKTAKACRTEQRRQAGWDSSSTRCDGWWQSPIGCPVIREVPVEVCEPAYPDNIISPDTAFVEFDLGFRDLWVGKAEDAEAARAAKEGERRALKASGTPKLTQALILLGGFLAIMFLFIVIAVERHLRRIRMQNAEAEA